MVLSASSLARDNAVQNFKYFAGFYHKASLFTCFAFSS
jgi:hypothetical protein